MSITTLYAELVVIGTGALVFILLFFYSFFGNQSWLSKLAMPASIGSTIYLIPVLSVIYLLGIVIANVSHLWFKSLEEQLRCKSLKKFDQQYQYDRLRNELYTSPEAKDLVGEFEFRRSKVRICRGWFLNCILIIAAVTNCLLSGKMGYPVALFWIGIVAALLVGTRVSWRAATDTELEWLNSYAEKLLQSQKAEKTALVPDAKS